MKTSLIPSLLLLGCLAGCIIDTSSHSERSGREIGRETIAEIQPGRTQEFVLALIGEPTTRSKAGERTEVWKWEFHSKERRNSSLIFVLDSDRTTEVRRTTYVLLEEGKVVRVWQD